MNTNVIYTNPHGAPGSVRSIEAHGPRAGGSRALQSLTIRYNGRGGTQHLYVSDRGDAIAGHPVVDFRVYDNRTAITRQHEVLDPIIALLTLGVPLGRALRKSLTQLAAAVPARMLPHLDTTTMTPHAVLVAARYPLLRAIAEQHPTRRLPCVATPRIASMCHATSLRDAAQLVTAPAAATREAAAAVLDLLCTPSGIPNARLLSLARIGSGLDRERFARLLRQIQPDGNVEEVPDHQTLAVARELQALGPRRHEQLAASILSRPDAPDIIAVIATRPDALTAGGSAEAIMQRARRPHTDLEPLHGMDLPTLQAQLEIVTRGQDARLRQLGLLMHNCIGTYSRGGIRELQPGCVFVVVNDHAGRPLQALHVDETRMITDWTGPFNHPVPVNQQQPVLDALGAHGVVPAEGLQARLEPDDPF